MTTSPQDIWHPHFLQFSPAFDPLATVCFGAWRTNQDWPELADYNRLLVALNKEIFTCSGKPICFTAVEKNPEEFSHQYEPHIYLQGEIQTRERNWHDFFNMLTWLTFPKTKAALNARHYVAMKKRWPQQKRRTPMENALTHFDESGVIIASADMQLDQAIIDFQWKKLFCDMRDRVKSQMAFFIFGHALYEKMFQPFVGLTGKAVVVHVEQAFFSWPLKQQLEIVDAMVSDHFSDSRYITAPTQLAPLPILGVPGWWAANEKLSFYDNTDYFRPGRSCQNM